MIVGDFGFDVLVLCIESFIESCLVVFYDMLDGIMCSVCSFDFECWWEVFVKGVVVCVIC